MPTSVYIIRHGAYDHRPSPEGTEASCDFGLSETGLEQVEALRQRLVRTGEIKADALFCSTLPRARQTASLIAPALRLEPRAMPELCEWESGSEQLGSEAFMSALQVLEGVERHNHRFWPGFETIHEFTERVHRKLNELVNAHEGKAVVLVTHGGVVEAAFHYFLGLRTYPFEGGYPAAGHTSITHWRRSTSRGDWIQDYANDTHHLRSTA